MNSQLRSKGLCNRAGKAWRMQESSNGPGMKREPVMWLVAAGVLTASWLVVPIALYAFDRPPADAPPGAFEVGPAWLYAWLLLDVVGTLCFLVLLVVRLFIVVADYFWDRMSQDMN